MPQKKKSTRRKVSAKQKSYRALVKKHGVEKAAQIWRKKK